MRCLGIDEEEFEEGSGEELTCGDGDGGSGGGGEDAGSGGEALSCSTLWLLGTPRGLQGQGVRLMVAEAFWT